VLPKIGREIGFGVEEEGGDVVLESALAAALVVDEVRLAVAEKNVAGLKIAIEEIVAWRGEEKFGEAVELEFESVLVEGDAGKAEKRVFELVKVQGDGLTVETGDGIADGIVEIAASFDLKARENGDDSPIGVDDWLRDGITLAILREELEERGVAEILFEVSASIEILGVDFGDRKAVTAKVLRESEEGGVFFADVVEDADGGGLVVGETNDSAAGAAEFALQRDDLRGGRAEMAREERFEDVDGHTASTIADFKGRNRGEPERLCLKGVALSENCAAELITELTNLLGIGGLAKTLHEIKERFLLFFVCREPIRKMALVHISLVYDDSEKARRKVKSRTL